MRIERASASTSLLDVLDRVLDKGIVIDAWVRVWLIGIDLITVQARVTVTSIETYLRYADLLAQTAPGALRPATGKREADSSRVFAPAKTRRGPFLA
jgi:hypothetical protein